MSNNGNLNKRRYYYANQKGKHGTYNFNCWGATLFVLGQKNRLEWIMGTYMQRFLDDNTVEISKQELQVGDIMAMHDRWGIEHTAVYVGRNLYFHKRGRNNSEIVTLEGIEETYPDMKITFRRIV